MSRVLFVSFVAFGVKKELHVLGRWDNGLDNRC